MRAAFRDVHGARLHGFAILVSLGDRRLAGRAAAAVLAEGIERAMEQRHPERAAAWLRGRVLRSLHRRPAFRGRVDDGERRSALRGLGAEDAAYDGLAALSIDERAALVASAIERFDPIDIEAILGTSATASRRRVGRARRRYLAAVVASPRRPDPAAVPGGELSDRVRELAQRMMGGHGG